MGRHHPRRRREGFFGNEVSIAISSAPKARRVMVGISLRGIADGAALSFRRSAVESIAEMLKVFLANVQLQDFFDHRQEVCQRADRTQRSRVGAPYHPPRRCQDECVFDCLQWHTALVQLGRQQTIRTTHHSRSARSRTVRFQQPANILARIDLARFIVQPRNSRNDGPSIVTVWQ